MKIVFLVSYFLIVFNYACGSKSARPSVEAMGYSSLPQKNGYPHPLQIWKYEGFDLGFCTVRKTPAWVAYNLGPNPGLYSFPRPSFRIDPNFRSLSTLAYSKSGFDRGHMAPNYGIMTRYGKQGQNDSFFMTNMVPMEPSLNRGIWASFESIVARRYANELGRVWIVTGPIFDSRAETLPSGVEIPDSFYKIVIDQLDFGPRALAIEMRNEKPKTKNWSRYLVSIDSIEAKTGLDFFNQFDDSIEARLESQVAVEIWGGSSLGATFNDTAKSNSINTSVGFKNEKNSVESDQTAQKRFWITSTGKTHNNVCRYFGTTKIGRYSMKPSGNDCKICGGSKSR